MYSLRDKYAIAGIGWTDYSRTPAHRSQPCVRSLPEGDRRCGPYGERHRRLCQLQLQRLGAGDFGRDRNRRAGARYANDFLSGGNAANMIVLTAAAVIEAGLAENVFVIAR